MKTPNGGSRPIPDPTELTDRAIARVEKSLTEYINSQLEVRDQRLRGIDEATKLRLDAVEEIPVQIDEKVGRLRDVHDERFRSIATQFLERDTRAERESKDNKVAVDAAFAAQKEAAAKQDESNQKAIDKSEKATGETIKTNQELVRATTDTLTKDVDLLKQQVTGILAGRAGQVEQRGEMRQSGLDARTVLFSTIGALVGLGLLAIALVNALNHP
jgi:hypothetical protein